MVDLALIIYGSLLLSSLRRRRRSYKFPHEPLDPVWLDEHNRLKIFNYGSYAFKDMLQEIDKATESIYLETYIFQDDEIGQEFKRRLVKKAKEGVKVYLAFDGFGSIQMPFGFRRWPKECIISWYGPLYSYLSLLWLGTYVRYHRKILIVDNKVAYIGGMNIGREYATTWRDTQLRIDGPTVEEVAITFAELWNKHQRLTPYKVLKLPFKPYPEDDNLLYLRQSRPNSASKSNNEQKTIQDTYIEAFFTAQNRILITNPYFLPDTTMEQALLGALNRGVKVEIIVPERTNHAIVDLLSRPILSRLIAAGGRVWLYQNTVIHSKTAVIDGHWSTIGSANLDGRSLINYEINLFVNSEKFARVMEEMWEDDLHNCREATLEEFSRPSRRRLLAEKIFAPVKPFV
jgi:cardiolipin synthase